MIPWLLVAQLLSNTQQCLSELVAKRMLAYPCSGEINYKVADTQHAIDQVMQYYTSENSQEKETPLLDRVDGISLEFSDWRFSLRASNTEPLLRLNVESKNNVQRVEEKVLEIEGLIN
jgi:phosphomannomutase